MGHDCDDTGFYSDLVGAFKKARRIGRGVIDIFLFLENLIAKSDEIFLFI